jgi:hypothetical protein
MASARMPQIEKGMHKIRAGGGLKEERHQGVALRGLRQGRFSPLFSYH